MELPPAIHNSDQSVVSDAVALVSDGITTFGNKTWVSRGTNVTLLGRNSLLSGM